MASHNQRQYDRLTIPEEEYLDNYGVDDTVVPDIVIVGASYEDLSEIDVANASEDDTTPVVAIDVERRSSLRRNSISLPNLADLKAFEEQVEVIVRSSAENLTSSSDNEDDDGGVDNDDDDGDDDVPVSYVPSRNARRKSVIANPKMYKSPNKAEDDSPPNNSPANSITSINSLASLLREKMQMLPSNMRKKKMSNYKTRVFVSFLFLVIMSLITCAYFLYHQKVLQRAYFEKVKINKLTRTMNIYDDLRHVMVTAKLGVTLNSEEVLPCLPSDEQSHAICLEWMNQARLYLRSYELEHGLTKCYSFHWLALAEHVLPTDCFDFSNGHWYGGGSSVYAKENRSFTPFVTGPVWGNVIKRYFISTKGVALLIDESSPLYVSISDSQEICLRGQYDDFAFVNRPSDWQWAQLNYSVCTNSASMSGLHAQLAENTLWDGLKKDDLQVMDSLLAEPLWQMATSGVNEEAIANYTNDVIGLGFLRQGHVLVPEYWQLHEGDFEEDLSRFATLSDTIDVMHRRGFRVVFVVQTFVSTESRNFAYCVTEGLLVGERQNRDRIPGLTQYKKVNTAGLLDVTNVKSMKWLEKKLHVVQQRLKLDSFFLDLGLAYDLPRYYHCQHPLINPDHYKTLLVDHLQNTVSVLGMNAAVKRPKPPSFVSLPPVESSWVGLQQVIPTILNYGVLGYPLVIPGAIGGDFNPMQYNYTAELLPDKELYIKWLQLSTFLPVVRYAHLPHTYGDDSLIELTKKLTTLRQTKVTPLLQKYARTALDTGLPIIRPLWLLDSNDPACHVVSDEFSVGDDLIVAPILNVDQTEREVYLPAGVWKDGIDSSLRKGNRWIHDYKVDVEEIPYFERMPDDTRF